MGMKELQAEIRQFADERDWQQFHSPKNLSMALIVEAAELVEHFQWVTEEQSKDLTVEKLEEVAMEIADIQIYLLRMADAVGVNIEKSVSKKMEKNRIRYSVEVAKGSSEKQ